MAVPPEDTRAITQKVPYSPIALGSLRTRVYNEVTFTAQTGNARRSNITISEPGTYFITVTSSPNATGGSNYMGMMQIRRTAANTVFPLGRLVATSISTFLTGSPVMLFSNDNTTLFIRSSERNKSTTSDTSFLVGYEGGSITGSIIINKL